MWLARAGSDRRERHTPRHSRGSRWAEAHPTKAIRTDWLSTRASRVGRVRRAVPTFEPTSHGLEARATVDPFATQTRSLRGIRRRRASPRIIPLRAARGKYFVRVSARLAIDPAAGCNCFVRSTPPAAPVGAHGVCPPIDAAGHRTRGPLACNGMYRVGRRKHLLRTRGRCWPGVAASIGGHTPCAPTGTNAAERLNHRESGSFARPDAIQVAHPPDEQLPAADCRRRVDLLAELVLAQ